jgi:uncharacterized protein YbaP (TraB family)
MFRILFLFVLLTNGVVAQIQKNALLWEVKSKDGKNVSYLYGTMHLMDADLFYFPKKLEKLILKSEVLCMEIASINPNLSPDALFMKDKTLTDIFSQSQLDSIYTWANKALLMNKEQFLTNFNSAKPFMLMQFIMQASLPTDTKSYEREFEAIAGEKNLQMKGLETVDEQLSLFDGFSTVEQVEMVMSSLRDEAQSKESFAKMQQLYLSQNLDELYDFMKKESDSPIASSRAFLEDRNQRWIPKMTELMQEKSVFFAVGAAHLAGPEGVIELLIKKGYTLTPIKL